MNPNYLYEMMRNQPLRSDINEPAGVPQTLSGLIAMENARLYAPSQFNFTPQMAQGFDQQAAQGQADLAKLAEQIKRSNIENQKLQSDLQSASLDRAYKTVQLADALGMPMGMSMDQASQKFLERKYGKSPPGYRFTQSGELEATPGGPADQKAQMKASGAADVDIALGTLRDAYNRLEQGGGITSTAKGPLDNIVARVSSSDIGQGVGKALGTSNQSARNDIAMTRPALLAALMKATGMSAKQMDSNAELKLWLTTATDPTLDVESNRRALGNIEKKYLGGQSVVDAGRQPASQNKPNLSSQDMQALDWAMKNKADPRAQQIMQRLGVR